MFYVKMSYSLKMTTQTVEKQKEKEQIEQSFFIYGAKPISHWPLNFNQFNWISIQKQKNVKIYIDKN